MAEVMALTPEERSSLAALCVQQQCLCERRALDSGDTLRRIFTEKATYWGALARKLADG
jgi:hypothetical protein